jgi:hypothetical protein
VCMTPAVISSPRASPAVWETLSLRSDPHHHLGKVAAPLPGVGRHSSKPGEEGNGRPELLTSGPCDLWSWDITKLKGPATMRASSGIGRSLPLVTRMFLLGLAEENPGSCHRAVAAEVESPAPPETMGSLMREGCAPSRYTRQVGASPGRGANWSRSAPASATRTEWPFRTR